MNVRLIPALILAVGGVGLLLAHPALYSRLWAYGVVVGLSGCGAGVAFLRMDRRDWPLSRKVSVALVVVGTSNLLSIAVN